MERLLTVNETCERLRWGRSQVYQHIRLGTLPSVLLGRRSRRIRARAWCSMTPAVVAWVEDTRTAQGLPPRVENPVTLDGVAAIIGVAEGGDRLARAS